MTRTWASRSERRITLPSPSTGSGCQRRCEKHRRTSAAQTVLVVEDDPNTREMLRRSMEKDGWTVHRSARTAGMASIVSDDEIPAIILLDLMMPEMDGFTFMRGTAHTGGLRATCPSSSSPPKTSPTKITAGSTAKSRASSKKAPTSTDRLLAEVRELLARPGRIARVKLKPIQHRTHHAQNPSRRRQRTEPRHALAAA